MIEKAESDVDEYYNPLIATFENGQLQSNQVDKLKCAVFRSSTNKRKLFAGATDKMTYISTNMEQDICHTMILIRNKRSHKIRVIPVNNVTLKPVLPIDKSTVDSTPLKKSSILDLNRQFGNKKMKRKTEQVERMKMNVSNVKQELENTVSDIKINAEDLIAPKINETVNVYRPPINRNASTVKEIYSLDLIITDEELDTLTELAEETLNNDFELSKFVPFVSENINKIKKLNLPNQLHKCRILLYIDAILKFFKVPAKMVGKKDMTIEPYPNVIIMKVLNEFTLRTDSGRTRPISMRDKATCYVLVLGLIVMDYMLDLETLLSSFSVGIKKLGDLSRLIGAQNQPNKPKNCICLKLPLPPEANLFVKKRK